MSMDTPARAMERWSTKQMNPHLLEKLVCSAYLAHLAQARPLSSQSLRDTRRLHGAEFFLTASRTTRTHRRESASCRRMICFTRFFQLRRL